MAIKRFYATADTTITNAYQENLKVRGDESNMGKADSLEIFSIFDQVETSTLTEDGRAAIVPHRELARIILKFDTEAILADEEIPSGASYYLRLFNAVHPHTLPTYFQVDVHPLTNAFEEGFGKDADNYLDSGSLGQPAAASWVARQYHTQATLLAASEGATGSFHVVTNPTSDITVTIGDHSLTIPAGLDEIASANAIKLAINDNAQASSLVTATANAADGTADGQVDLVAKDIGGNFIPITISSETGTLRRNVTGWGGIGVSGASGVVNLSSGVDAILWDSPGGDYDSSDTIGSQSFPSGDEDLLVDVSSFISSIDAGATDSGLMVKMGVSEEAAATSYYTKKFFARSSQYFFLRPCIEVRWDSSTQDDRGKFYASHPMRGDNANTIVLKNYVDGALAVPATAPTGVDVWVDSTKNVPLLSANAVNSTATGVYTSSITLDTDLESVYVEWTNGATVLHTEEIKVLQRSATTTNTTPEYVVSITNIKKAYLGKDPDEDTIAESARFRLYVRPKNWNPNIYTKASSDIENTIVEQAYYKVVRVADDFVVIDYGQGDDEHTKLSYDQDGSYFDLDMSLLEKGYSYEIQFMFVLNGEVREQPEKFKFRVE